MNHQDDAVANDSHVPPGDQELLKTTLVVTSEKQLSRRLRERRDGVSDCGH
jgi:hypothetical protein